MKPSFALDLSPDGIVLLHRSGKRWNPVGNVALDSADLSADMAVLHRTAAELSPAGVTVKLIIPDEQILYRTIPDPGEDEAARHRAIRAAMDGATPYGLDEIVYDWRVTGEDLRFAAVARETLDEAESFALEHKFIPINFAGADTAGGYGMRPSFGRAASAAAYDESDGIEEADINTVAQAAETSLILSVEDATSIAPEVLDTLETAAAPEKAAAEATADDTPEPDAIATQADAEKSKAFVSRRASNGAAPSIEQPDLSGAASRLALGVTKAKELAKTPALAGAVRSAETTHMAITAPLVAEEEPALEIKTPPARKAPSRSKAGPLPEPPPVPSPRIPPRVDVEPGLVPPRTDFARSKAPAVEPPVVLSDTEAEQLTVFGARKKDARKGGIRNLGLMLTLGLAIALAVAFWAAGFLVSDGSGPEPSADIAAPSLPDTSSSLSGEDALPPGTAPAAQPERDAANDVVRSTDTGTLADLEGDAPLDLAARAPEPAPIAQSDAQTAAQAEAEIAAEQDADLAELADEPDVEEDVAEAAAEPEPQPLSRDELATRYAATGIWQQTPDQIAAVDPADDLRDLYVASIDPNIAGQDAVAMPAQPAQPTDLPPLQVTAPAAPRVTFDLDERGLVRATPQGAVTPDGIVVYEGRPAKVTAVRPESAADAIATTAQDEAQAQLAGRKPRLRPEDLIEQNERANLGGLTFAQMGQIRPKLRPAGIAARAQALAAAQKAAEDASLAAAETAAQAAAAEAASAVASAVAQAAAQPAPSTASDATLAFAAPSQQIPAQQIVVSRAFVQARPAPRPGNFAQIVARARAAQPTAPATTEGTGDTPEVQAASAPRAPSIPTSASVARQATVRNAINLNRVNLIGVYGSNTERRALVRLPTGSYVKVKVGDRIDGGRVRSIGTNELVYEKSGRNVSLKVSG